MRALLLLPLLLAACAATPRHAAPPAPDAAGALPEIARRSVVAMIVERTGTGDAFGSGVVYDARGHVLTLHHVVQDASRIVVLLPQGHTARAIVVAADPVADFAIIRMEHWQPGLVAPAEFETGEPEVGQSVWSIGNPFGLSRFGGEVSVSRGVISARGRSFFNEQTRRLYLRAMQHDAATNPGSSGGGLFNAQGRLVGLNALITTAREIPGDSGVSFALPALLVRQMAETLLIGGSVRHAWLGAENYRQATEMLPHGGGRLRTVFGAVARTGPAHAAGVQEGDVIIQLDGRELHGLHETLDAENALQPGRPVSLLVNRAGTELTLTITPGHRPWGGQ